MNWRGHFYEFKGHAYGFGGPCDDDVVVSDAEIVRRRDAMWGLLCSVEVLLPCKSCQEHFATHLRMLRENAERREEVLHDRESVMLWLYSVKDEVDRMQRFCLI